MLFRLSNALASFQGYIKKILGKKLDIFVILYLDDIFIYIKDLSQGYIEAVTWVLDVLRKQKLFAYLKKYQLYKDEIHFLSYVVSAKRVKIEDEQIKAVINWPKPTSVRDIVVFIDFANFYQYFI